MPRVRASASESALAPSSAATPRSTELSARVRYDSASERGPRQTSATSSGRPARSSRVVAHHVGGTYFGAPEREPRPLRAYLVVRPALPPFPPALDHPVWLYEFPCDTACDRELRRRLRVVGAGRPRSALAPGVPPRDRRGRACAAAREGLTPSEVTEDDLRRLYDAVAPRAGAESGQEAFEEALHALDDSMLCTYEDVGRVFVAARDRSTEDYLREHVAGHPEHARALLESAQAFEQVEWLLRRADADRLLADPEALASAVKRTFTAPSVSWRPVYWGEGNGESS
jgi:hypothetical protein